MGGASGLCHAGERNTDSSGTRTKLEISSQLQVFKRKGAEGISENSFVY